MESFKIVWSTLSRSQKIAFGVFWALVIGGILTLVFTTAVSADVSKQPGGPEADIWSVNNVYLSEDLKTFLYQSLTDFEVYFQERDLNDIFISERLATESEELTYFAQKDSRVIELNQLGVIASIKADPDSTGNWLNWLNARTVELNQCESDATAALTLGNWSTYGIGQQNAVIESLLECQELNSRVNRKTIQNLYEILVAEGLILVTQ